MYFLASEIKIMEILDKNKEDYLENSETNDDISTYKEKMEEQNENK